MDRKVENSAPIFRKAYLSKKHRKFRPLIEIESGPKKYMLLSRAMAAIDKGLAVLVNGRIRFTEDTTNLGYNAASGHWRWRGKQSGIGGPTVMQAVRFLK